MEYLENIEMKRPKFLVAVLVMFAMLIAASREFYLFVALRDSQSLLDIQGARYHLWLALGATLTAWLASGLMFWFFLSRGSRKGDLRTA